MEQNSLNSCCLSILVWPVLQFSRIYLIDKLNHPKNAYRLWFKIAISVITTILSLLLLSVVAGLTQGWMHLDNSVIQFIVIGIWVIDYCYARSTEFSKGEERAEIANSNPILRPLCQKDGYLGIVSAAFILWITSPLSIRIFGSPTSFPKRVPGTPPVSSFGHEGIASDWVRASGEFRLVSTIFNQGCFQSLVFDKSSHALGFRLAASLKEAAWNHVNIIIEIIDTDPNNWSEWNTQDIDSYIEEFKALSSSIEIESLDSHLYLLYVNKTFAQAGLPPPIPRSEH